MNDHECRRIRKNLNEEKIIHLERDVAVKNSMKKGGRRGQNTNTSVDTRTREQELQNTRCAETGQTR